MTATGPAQSEFDLDLSLRRIVVGYRIVGAVWLTALAIVALTIRRDVEHAWVVGFTVAVVLAWTIATVSINTRRPEWFDSEFYALIDAVIAVGALLAPIAAGTVDFYGGYPLSALFFAIYSRTALDGVLTAAALGVASVIQAIPTTTRNITLIITQTIFYLFIWFAVRWTFRVLRRTDQSRRAAESALSDERTERIRAEERSEMAAVLHDSVLQTLSLMQRRSEDAAEVRSLARYQERQLRERLFGFAVAETTTLASAITSTMADVEDLHRVRVETVVVGDCNVDDDIEALVHAGREAVVNAAKHAGVDTVSVYAEVASQRISLFVRDRGQGFDPETASASGSGIGESIIARLERRGGSAAIRSSPANGTEVEMWVPRSPD